VEIVAVQSKASARNHIKALLFTLRLYHTAQSKEIFHFECTSLFGRCDWLASNFFPYLVVSSTINLHVAKPPILRVRCPRPPVV
jgi:hypothetical protein